MKLGDVIYNRIDPKDGGQYKIVVVRKIGYHWMYTAVAQNERCVYRSIGGALS